MIEYEFNVNKQRWEFMFLTPDKKKCSLGYLDPNMSEDQRMKMLVGWFNACMRQYKEYEEETPKQ